MFPIAIIGSGVIGLTSGVRLLEAGFAVTIYAKATPPHTTSDVAAAYWSPSATLHGGHMRRWALTSLATFRELMADPASGIRQNDLFKLTEGPAGPPHPALPVPAEAVPPGHFPAPWSGVRVTVPQVDVPVYMPWLFARFQQLGGEVRNGEIGHFEELASKHRVVVNCSGLGAGPLTGDEMFPIRGQVIRVRKPPELPPAMLYAETAGEVTYIIPRSGDCLLGGTYHYGDNRQEIDEAIAAGILRRCAQLEPRLAQPEILEHRVGLRPGRRAVRLEREQRPDGLIIIHNYGHAALGHTLSWGCAAEAVALVQQTERS
jgi:D-amino-acid oxidase